MQRKLVSPQIIKVPNPNHFFQYSASLERSVTEVKVVAPKGVILTADLQPGYGKAVFISGADCQLGKWGVAERLLYNEDSNKWEFTVPSGVKEADYKFLTGDFQAGRFVPSSELMWDQGGNRQLDLTSNNEVSGSTVTLR